MQLAGRDLLNELKWVRLTHSNSPFPALPVVWIFTYSKQTEPGQAQPVKCILVTSINSHGTRIEILRPVRFGTSQISGIKWCDYPYFTKVSTACHSLPARLRGHYCCWSTGDSEGKARYLPEYFTELFKFSVRLDRANLWPNAKKAKSCVIGQCALWKTVELERARRNIKASNENRCHTACVCVCACQSRAEFYADRQQKHQHTMIQHVNHF